MPLPKEYIIIDSNIEGSLSGGVVGTTFTFAELARKVGYKEVQLVLPRGLLAEQTGNDLDPSLIVTKKELQPLSLNKVRNAFIKHQARILVPELNSADKEFVDYLADLFDIYFTPDRNSFPIEPRVEKRIQYTAWRIKKSLGEPEGYPASPDKIDPYNFKDPHVVMAFFAEGEIRKDQMVLDAINKAKADSADNSIVAWYKDSMAAMQAEGIRLSFATRDRALIKRMAEVTRTSDNQDHYKLYDRLSFVRHLAKEISAMEHHIDAHSINLSDTMETQLDRLKRHIALLERNTEKAVQKVTETTATKLSAKAVVEMPDKKPAPKSLPPKKEKPKAARIVPKKTMPLHLTGSPDRGEIWDHEKWSRQAATYDDLLMHLAALHWHWIPNNDQSSVFADQQKGKLRAVHHFAPSAIYALKAHIKEFGDNIGLTRAGDSLWLTGTLADIKEFLKFAPQIESYKSLISDYQWFEEEYPLPNHKPSVVAFCYDRKISDQLINAVHAAGIPKAYKYHATYTYIPVPLLEASPDNHYVVMIPAECREAFEKLLPPGEEVLTDYTAMGIKQFRASRKHEGEKQDIKKHHFER